MGTGACAADVKASCKESMPGEGRIAFCLTTRIRAMAKGNVVGKRISFLPKWKCPRLTDHCFLQAARYPISVSMSLLSLKSIAHPTSTRIYHSVRLYLNHADWVELGLNRESLFLIAARACKDDVPKVCKGITDASPGSVLACLR